MAKFPEHVFQNYDDAQLFTLKSRPKRSHQLIQSHSIYENKKTSSKDKPSSSKKKMEKWFQKSTSSSYPQLEKKKVKSDSRE